MFRNHHLAPTLPTISISTPTTIPSHATRQQTKRTLSTSNYNSHINSFIINSDTSSDSEEEQSRTMPKTKQPTKQTKLNVNKPFKKAKKNCFCGECHKSEAECEWAQTLLIHTNISTSVILESEGMVKVLVGSGGERKKFFVHKELLVLHSGLFESILSEGESEGKNGGRGEEKVVVKVELNSAALGWTGDLANLVDSSGYEALACQPYAAVVSRGPENIQTVTMSAVDPVLFANFCSWLYTGYLSKEIAAMKKDSTEHADMHILLSLYPLSFKLLSPAFQNVIIDLICDLGRNVLSNINPEQMRQVWKDVSNEGMGNGGGNDGSGNECMLRKLFASSVAAGNPFEKYALGTNEPKEWEKLFIEIPEISLAVQAASSRWHHADPWDDEYRNEYMVEEGNLAKCWEDMIFQKNAKEDIETDAETGSVKAKLELAHFRREGSMSMIELNDSEDESSR